MEKFLTNTAMVYSYISEHTEETAKNIASSCGITERTTLDIINKLNELGYIKIEKIGRNNKYKILKHFDDIVDNELGVLT